MARKTEAPGIKDIDPAMCINSKLRRLARMTTHVYERNFKVFDLRSSQVSILLMLGKMGSCNQKMVADFLFVDYSTMSRDLNRLKERKLIRIVRGEDARHSFLELTAKGNKLLNELIPVWKVTNKEMEDALGSFSVGYIDTITAAVKQHTTR